MFFSKGFSAALLGENGNERFHYFSLRISQGCPGRERTERFLLFLQFVPKGLPNPVSGVIGGGGGGERFHYYFPVTFKCCRGVLLHFL